MGIIERRGPSRRTVLVGGAAAVGVGIAGFVAACAGPTPSPSSTASGADPRTWAELASATGGRLVRSGDAAWDTDRVLENPRFDDADPRGILRAASESDVLAGLAFARNTGTPVALRSGGHSYTGWSAGGAPGTNVPASLVISTADIDHVVVSSDGGTVRVGPGARLAAVYDTLAAHGRAIGAGSCPTVGVGGLTLGGGVGVLVRSLGLTCDQLEAVTIVTADGTVHDVDASSTGSDADLFWACRGGGGGTVGVVTELTFRTVPAPPVLVFSLTFPWTAAASVVAAWQDWAPSADPRLWSTLKLLAGAAHPDGPVVSLTGTWTGPQHGADQSVDAFIARTGVTPLTHTATPQTYGDAMRALAGCSGLTLAQCSTGPGGRLQRVPEAATSSIGRQTLTGPEIDTLVAEVGRAAAVDGLSEGGVSLDALGGAVGKPAPADTVFPWRDALWTAQYTAVFADGADPAPFDAYVRGFRSAMTPAWGDAAYANYLDATITDPAAYFGDNTARLRRIVRRVDPKSRFAQPDGL
jgi:FAD/FMN-containing dehydrogenase